MTRKQDSQLDLLNVWETALGPSKLKRQNLNESLLVGPKQAHSVFVVCVGIFKPLAKPIFVFKPLAKPTCHFDMISGHKKIETHKSWPSA